tara:strand:- start:6475 stop:6822 length:348 start_codon:yes stop_codon:yes gene_type:complete
MDDFKAPSLTSNPYETPKDMSDLSNYTAQQLEDMAKAEMSQGAKGKTFGGFGRDNVGDNAGIANALHKQYLNNMGVFYGNYKGQNISSQQAQGGQSPFDTARSRYAPNQAQQINF